MKKILKKILSINIDVNMLKLIAVFAMSIDHIGHYFQTYISNEIYISFRIIGRIAMPIFTYCIVQGFFYTKNFKKYVKRIGILAIITQLLISVLGIINIYFVPQYTVNVYRHGNILISFTLGLILLYFIHNRIVIEKWDYNKNLLLKVGYCLLLTAIYIFVPIDYEFQVILLMTMLYFIEKLKISTYLSRQITEFNVKKVVATTISEDKIKLIYNIMVTFVFMLDIVYLKGSIYMLLAIPFIWLYNGEKKERKYITNKMFYYFYPIHHVLIYGVALGIKILIK